MAAPAGRHRESRHAQPAPHRARLSREWKRLPSAQFTIVGTSSARDLAQLGVELETFLGVLQQMTPSLRPRGCLGAEGAPTASDSGCSVNLPSGRQAETALVLPVCRCREA